MRSVAERVTFVAAPPRRQSTRGSTVVVKLEHTISGGEAVVIANDAGVDEVANLYAKLVGFGVMSEEQADEANLQAAREAERRLDAAAAAGAAKARVDSTLEQMRSNSIVEADFRDSELSDEEARALGAALELNSSVQIMILTRCKMSDNAVIAISEGLRSSASVQVVYFNDAGVTDVGCGALADMLTHNKVVQTLYLDSNKISDQSATKLADGITANKANGGKFVSMDYDTNLMTSEGEAAIAQAMHEASKMGGGDTGYPPPSPPAQPLPRSSAKLPPPPAAASPHYAARLSACPQRSNHSSQRTTHLPTRPAAAPEAQRVAEPLLRMSNTF